MMRVLAAALCLSFSADELVDGGSFDSDAAGWWPLPATATAQAAAEFDATVGASKPGSLRLRSADPADGALRMWSRTIPLGRTRPTRLRLAASVRAEGLGENSSAQLMAQLWPEEGDCLSYPRTLLVDTACDWTETSVVFDVPEETARVHLIFFLKGTGRAWLDDVSMSATDDAVTHAARPAPRRNDPRLEALARGAAAEIDWIFDGQAARNRAAKEDRPVLLYVRCTDAEGGVAAMRAGLDAPGIPMAEDGFAKDVLFRAGPLSTPRIVSVITEHFVPAIAAYDLGASRGRSNNPPAWFAQGAATESRLVGLADEGAAAPGCLAIDTEAGEGLRMWAQVVDWTGEECEMRLGAAMQAKSLAPGGEVNVMLQCWKGTEALAYARLDRLVQDADWTTSEVTFTVPEGVERIRLLAYLKGPGAARFDDFELSRTGDDSNLLKNGDLRETAPPAPQLDGFPVDPGDVTTPALCVFAPSGELVARLDRQGTLSDELVGAWLVNALAAVPEASDAPRPKVVVGKPARPLRSALALMASAEWERAAAALARAGAAAGEEGTFLRALCLHRSGEHDAAVELWESLVSETAWGRKAAACLLVRGPRLHESISYRSWPKDDRLILDTEGFGESFDLEGTVVALLELQRPGGSFGSQFGQEGLGWNDAAITSIAIDALRGSRDSVGRRLRKRIDRAVGAAREFLVAYAADASRPRWRSAAFSNPYVLNVLLALDEPGAAQAMVAHIAHGQEEDGNWTVYGPQRPASFNTAQNVLALLAARRAALEVPDGTIERGLDALEAMRAASGLFPYSSATGHDWMTTNHGAIGRDPLCEHALLDGGRGSSESLEAALRRYLVHGEELREPTKRLYDYFNGRGHGGYFFFFAHRRALEAAQAFAAPKTLTTVRSFVRQEVLAAREGDGTFMDKFNLGRAYGTAQALVLLANP